MLSNVLNTEVNKTFSEIAALKPAIKIKDTGESITPLMEDKFLFYKPHSYQSRGAPYGDKSPYSLRESAAEKLCKAQERLEALKPGYKLKIFDGFRPLEVQEYMVELTFNDIVNERGLKGKALSESLRSEIEAQVLSLWARPNRDPLQPPPHSTGGAVDLTIADKNGCELDMGSPIDAFPPLSLPHHFEGNSDPQSKLICANRELLNKVMSDSGFVRLTHEWWHFSYGDQMWALINSLKNPAKSAEAFYGAVKI